MDSERTAQSSEGQFPSWKVEEEETSSQSSSGMELASKSPIPKTRGAEVKNIGFIIRQLELETIFYPN